MGRKTSPEDEAKVRALVGEGLTPAEITERTGIKRPTVYKIIDRLGLEVVTRDKSVTEKTHARAQESVTPEPKPIEDEGQKYRRRITAEAAARSLMFDLTTSEKGYRDAEALFPAETDAHDRVWAQTSWVKIHTKATKNLIEVTGLTPEEVDGLVTQDWFVRAEIQRGLEQFREADP